MAFRGFVADESSGSAALPAESEDSAATINRVSSAKNKTVPHPEPQRRVGSSLYLPLVDKTHTKRPRRNRRDLSLLTIRGYVQAVRPPSPLLESLINWQVAGLPFYVFSVPRHIDVVTNRVPGIYRKYLNDRGKAFYLRQRIGRRPSAYEISQNVLSCWRR